MDRVDIEYTLTADDVIALNRHRSEYLFTGQRKSWARRWTGSILAGLFLLLFVYRLFVPPVSDDGAAPRSSPHIVVFVLAVCCVVYLIRKPLSALLVRRGFRNSDVPESAHAIRLSITADEFSRCNDVASGTYTWNGVPGVAITSDRLFVSHNERETTLIPQRAFAEPTVWRQLLASLEANYRGNLLDRTKAPPKWRRELERSTEADSSADTSASPHGVSPGAEHVVVEFDPRAEDLIALRRYSKVHLPDGQPLSRVHRGAVFVAPFLFIAGLLLTTNQKPQADGRATSTIAVYVLISALLVFAFRRLIAEAWIRRSFNSRQPNSPMRRRRTYSLSPASFHVTTPGSSETFRWGVINRIVFKSDYVLLMVSPQSAHVIPRRAFTDAAHWEAMLTMLKRNFPGQLQHESS